MSALQQTFSVLTHTTAGSTVKASNTTLAADDLPALTAGLGAGNEDAFRQFHELYFDRLFRYHLVLARGDEEAAQDALQETFLRVARHARRFERADVFWSWLTVLCRSAATDSGRKRRRYWNLLANYARSLISPAPSPVHVNDSGDELYEVLNQALAELGAEDRQLIEAKYFRRASMRELAIETRLSERAVESRLFRARNDLRARITAILNHERTT